MTALTFTCRVSPYTEKKTDSMYLKQVFYCKASRQKKKLPPALLPVNHWHQSAITHHFCISGHFHSARKMFYCHHHLSFFLTRCNPHHKPSGVVLIQCHFLGHFFLLSFLILRNNGFKEWWVEKCIDSIFMHFNVEPSLSNPQIQPYMFLTVYFFYLNLLFKEKPRLRRSVPSLIWSETRLIKVWKKHATGSSSFQSMK